MAVVATAMSCCMHEVTCLGDGTEWVPWTDGGAPGWVSLDERAGVRTALWQVEAGTTAVIVRSAEGRETCVDVLGSRFAQVRWAAGADPSAGFPAPVRVLVDGAWHDTLAPGLAVRPACVVAAYLRYQRDGDKADGWAWEVVHEVAMDDPGRAWPLVLDLINQSTDEAALFYLAAGPLEDLLSHHLATVIGRVEQEAASNPRFRRALGGVWHRNPDPSLDRRLLAAGPARAVTGDRSMPLRGQPGRVQSWRRTS